MYPSWGHWRRYAHAVSKGVALAQPAYRPRDAEHTVLHAVIREHLEDFLRAAILDSSSSCEHRHLGHRVIPDVACRDGGPFEERRGRYQAVGEF